MAGHPSYLPWLLYRFDSKAFLMSIPHSFYVKNMIFVLGIPSAAKGGIYLSEAGHDDKIDTTAADGIYNRQVMGAESMLRFP